MSSAESDSTDEVAELPLLADDQEHSPMVTSAGWNEAKVFKLQAAAHLLSHILAAIAIVLVGWWVQLLGGLSWEKGHAKQVFNYHPLMMVLVFAFMTVASLAFRTTMIGNRYTRKMTHAISFGVATVCGVVGVMAAFKSHNDADSGFIANLYSFHSWIGLMVIGFYILQFSVGMYAFLVGNPSWKPIAHAIHKYVGPLIYQGCALSLLLGIQEKEGFVGCGYKVDEADLWPANHFFDIPLPCRVSHALGLCIFIMAASTIFALADFRRLASQEQHVL